MTEYVLVLLIGVFATMPPSEDWEIQARYRSASDCQIAWQQMEPWQRTFARCVTDAELAELRKPKQTLAVPTPFLSAPKE